MQCLLISCEHRGSQDKNFQYALKKAEDYGQLYWGRVLPSGYDAPQDPDRGRETPTGRREPPKTSKPKKRKGIGEQDSEDERDEDYEPEEEDQQKPQKKKAKVSKQKATKKSKKDKSAKRQRGQRKEKLRRPSSAEDNASDDDSQKRPPILDLITPHDEVKEEGEFLDEQTELGVPAESEEEIEENLDDKGKAEGDGDGESDGEAKSEGEVEGEVEGDDEEEEEEKEEESSKKRKAKVSKSLKKKKSKKSQSGKRSKKNKAEQTQSARQAANEVALARQDEAEEFAEHMQHAALAQTQLQKRYHVTEEERFLLKLKQEHKVRKFDLPIERMYRAPLWLQQRPEDDQYVDQLKEMLFYNRFSHVPDIYVVAVKLSARGKKARETTWPLHDEFFSNKENWEQFQSKDIFLTQARGLFEDGQVKEDDPIEWPNPKVMAENPNSKHDEIYYLVIGGNHGVAAIKKHIMELPDQKHANLMFRTAQVYINVTPHQIRMLGLESNLALSMQKKTSFWEQVSQQTVVVKEY